jgi:hypothetical protein
MKPAARNLVVALVLLAATPAAVAEIYKVVNPDGSVTYTDQRPATGAEPVDLPPLSVVETDIDTSAITAKAAADEAREPTLRDLRRQFSDFRITQPQNEETFWGTANTVTVSWGAAQPIPDSLAVTLFVNGRKTAAPDGGSATLTLDRGEHQVYAELRDERNRLVTRTEVVTFFIKQYSQNFGQPRPTPRGGS